MASEPTLSEIEKHSLYQLNRKIICVVMIVDEKKYGEFPVCYYPVPVELFEPYRHYLDGTYHRIAAKRREKKQPELNISGFDIVKFRDEMKKYSLEKIPDEVVKFPLEYYQGLMSSEEAYRIKEKKSIELFIGRIDPVY
ncbi:MAG: hypothetical protein Solumvirus2_19 [Solumvirus sp.]|uniref:Uncharacterized protein n=1 Tax=Solumvirus sp. TaxID=2487773 RepID=A0A3G5AGB7_9VIRU|nr:MAG: hypothetical protein Solumvirus2_19 [Solumvirus sp.]